MCQIYEKNSYSGSSYEVTPFRPKMIFVLEEALKQFPYTSWAISSCKISKQSLEWIQSYDDAPFSRQNGPFGPNEFFFKKTINIRSMHLLVPLIVQDFKKILRVDPEL